MKQSVPLSRRIRAIPVRSREAVHDIRVMLKTLRAGLKLCDDKTRGVKKRLRKLQTHGRALSAVRDSESRREIVLWLRARGVRVPRHRTSLKDIARNEIHKRVRRAATDALEAAAFLEMAIGRIPPRRIRQRLRRSARRVAKARRRYEKSSSLENLHRWRKRTKDYQYQLRQWAPDPGVRAKEETRLKRAGRKLGRARDLRLLGMDLKAMPMGTIDPAVIASIEKLARRLVERVLRK